MVDMCVTDRHTWCAYVHQWKNGQKVILYRFAYEKLVFFPSALTMYWMQ